MTTKHVHVEIAGKRLDKQGLQNTKSIQVGWFVLGVLCKFGSVSEG